MQNFARADLQRLAVIIREVTGNNIQEKNFSMVESRIRSHMIRLNIETIEQYWAYYNANEMQERMTLQSLMTTHHTFFFRERVHFEVLEKWLENESTFLVERFKKTKAPVKVWSSACSRGQEVYSLAMFLEFALYKKHGVPFEIIGTDIDAESISYAKNGVYPIKEVNAIPKSYLNGYWKKGTGPIKEFAAVHPNLKTKTKFKVLNILDLKENASNEKYDIIFCRNLFIYFAEESIHATAKKLAQRISQRGLLITGISEPLHFAGWNYESIGPSCYQIGEGIKKESKAHVINFPSPAAASTAAAPKVSTPPAAVAFVSPPAQQYSVLCVDDSATIQLMMKKIFAEDPHCKHIDFAFNGKQAREKLNVHKYDLITLDIHMPEVSGIAFLENLYNIKKDPPVLMISSVDRTDIALASKALALGAFDYVEKPEMNNLRKSVDEILTKAKMALRFTNKDAAIEESAFDKSIARKIVVPDASQCLRIVLGSAAKLNQLEQIIKGQEDEYRSPATLIIWKDSDDLGHLQKALLNCSVKKLNVIRDSAGLLRPNQIYLVHANFAKVHLESVPFKSVSLQVLDRNVYPADAFKMPSLQILLDESLISEAAVFEKSFGVRIHDVTPATSFPSLSVEFFANIRKLAA